jgi:hypothetical protein
VGPHLKDLIEKSLDLTKKHKLVDLNTIEASKNANQALFHFLDGLCD